MKLSLGDEGTQEAVDCF